MLLDQPGRTSFFIALLAALACCLAFGNGLAILAFGALQLWLQGHRVTRLAIWLLWSTAIVVVYFQAYQQPELLQAIFKHGDQQVAWQLALAEPLKFGQWMLAVIGSGFTFGHGGFRILAGGTLVAMWLFLLVRREDKRQLVTMLFSTFLLATLVLVANKHFALEFADLDLPNRYSFYSIVLGMFLLAAFTRHCQNRDIDLPAYTGIWATLLLGAMFNAFAWWWGMAKAEYMIKPFHANLLNWMQRGDTSLPALATGYPATKLRQAMAAGIYTPYKAIPAGHEPASIDALGSCDGTTIPAPTPPPAALVLRMDRAGLNNPLSSGVAVCVGDRAYDMVFRELPVYIRLPLPDGPV